MIMLFFSSRRRHTRYWRDWSSDVYSSDLGRRSGARGRRRAGSGGRRRPRAPGGTAPPACRRGTAAAGRRAGRGPRAARDWKSVVEGKSVDMGGRRIIKKKKVHVRLLTIIL